MAIFVSKLQVLIRISQNYFKVEDFHNFML